MKEFLLAAIKYMNGFPTAAAKSNIEKTGKTIYLRGFQKAIHVATRGFRNYSQNALQVQYR